MNYLSQGDATSDEIFINKLFIILRAFRNDRRAA
jgi:hypothetical protein